jgi:hypothetical protein
MNVIVQARDMVNILSYVNDNEPSNLIKKGNTLTSFETISYSRRRLSMKLISYLIFHVK